MNNVSQNSIFFLQIWHPFRLMNKHAVLCAHVGLLNVVYEALNLKLSFLSCLKAPECCAQTHMRQMVEKCAIKRSSKCEIYNILIPFIDLAGWVAGSRVNYITQNGKASFTLETSHKYFEEL